MNIACYRCLYGQDFIQESIKSIDPYVDKIFIFWDDRPWGNVTSCNYKGVEQVFPNKFDNILEKIEELKNPKIQLIYNHQENNNNQFTNLINKYVIPNFYDMELIIIPEVDHVLRKDQIEGSIDYIKANGIMNASTQPIELWKEPKYRIPHRDRMCTMFWNLQKVNLLLETGRQANSKYLQFIPFYTHNFGFCCGLQTMYWKHLTSLAFSRKIGDDVPDENWLDKWIGWTIDGPLNKDLEISAGYQHYITHAYPYDTNELPQIIKEKYEY